MALVQEEKNQKEEIRDMTHVQEEKEQQDQDEPYYIRVNLSDDEDEDPIEYENIPSPPPMTDEELAQYYRFEGAIVGGVAPCDIDKSNEQLLTHYSKQALQVYKEQNVNASFEFDCLVKANEQGVAGFMYYITFAALSSGTSRTFRGKVWRKINNQGPQFCEMI